MNFQNEDTEVIFRYYYSEEKTESDDAKISQIYTEYQNFIFGIKFIQLHM